MSDKQADAMRLKYLRSLHLINPEDPVTIKKKENIIPDPAITTETPTLDQPQLMFVMEGEDDSINDSRYGQQAQASGSPLSIGSQFYGNITSGDDGKTNENGTPQTGFVPPHILAMKEDSEDPTRDVPDSSSRRQIYMSSSP